MHTGSETQCLDALRHATNPHRLHTLLPSLPIACSALHSQNLNLFAAAAGVSARLPAAKLEVPGQPKEKGVGSAEGCVGASAAASEYEAEGGPQGGAGGGAGKGKSASSTPGPSFRPDTSPAPPPYSVALPIEPTPASRTAAATATAAAAAARAPYPPPTSLDVHALSQALFDGYAAAWLSMVAAQKVEASPNDAGVSECECVW